jgi:hypothetical protein
MFVSKLGVDGQDEIENQLCMTPAILWIHAILELDPGNVLDHVIRGIEGRWASDGPETGKDQGACVRRRLWGDAWGGFAGGGSGRSVAMLHWREFKLGITCGEKRVQGAVLWQGWGRTQGWERGTTEGWVGWSRVSDGGFSPWDGLQRDDCSDRFRVIILSGKLRDGRRSSGTLQIVKVDCLWHGECKLRRGGVQRSGDGWMGRTGIERRCGLVIMVILWWLTALIGRIIRIGDGRVWHGTINVVKLVELYGRSGGIVGMIDKRGRGIFGSKVGGRDAWHAGETQLAKVGCVKKGVMGEIGLAVKCCGAVMVACRAWSNITAQSYEKLVYSRELFWGADVERDGAWIEIRVIVIAIRVVLVVSEIVESFGHGGIVGGVDATFLDVEYKVVDGVVIMWPLW